MGDKEKYEDIMKREYEKIMSTVARTSKKGIMHVKAGVRGRVQAIDLGDSDEDGVDVGTILTDPNEALAQGFGGDGSFAHDRTSQETVIPNIPANEALIQQANAVFAQMIANRMTTENDKILLMRQFHTPEIQWCWGATGVYAGEDIVEPMSATYLAEHSEQMKGKDHLTWSIGAHVKETVENGHRKVTICPCHQYLRNNRFLNDTVGKFNFSAGNFTAEIHNCIRGSQYLAQSVVIVDTEDRIPRVISALPGFTATQEAHYVCVPITFTYPVIRAYSDACCLFSSCILDTIASTAEFGERINPLEAGIELCITTLLTSDFENLLGPVIDKCFGTSAEENACKKEISRIIKSRYEHVWPRMYEYMQKMLIWRSNALLFKKDRDDIYEKARILEMASNSEFEKLKGMITSSNIDTSRLVTARENSALWRGFMTALRVAVQMLTFQKATATAFGDATFTTLRVFLKEELQKAWDDSSVGFLAILQGERANQPAGVLEDGTPDPSVTFATLYAKSVSTGGEIAQITQLMTEVIQELNNLQTKILTWKKGAPQAPHAGAPQAGAPQAAPQAGAPPQPDDAMGTNVLKGITVELLCVERFLDAFDVAMKRLNDNTYKVEISAIHDTIYNMFYRVFNDITEQAQHETPLATIPYKLLDGRVTDLAGAVTALKTGPLCQRMEGKFRSITISLVGMQQRVILWNTRKAELEKAAEDKTKIQKDLDETKGKLETKTKELTEATRVSKEIDKELKKQKTAYETLHGISQKQFDTIERQKETIKAKDKTIKERDATITQLQREDAAAAATAGRAAGAAAAHTESAAVKLLQDELKLRNTEIENWKKKEQKFNEQNERCKSLETQLSQEKAEVTRLRKELDAKKATKDDAYEARIKVLETQLSQEKAEVARQKRELEAKKATKDDTCEQRIRELTEAHKREKALTDQKIELQDKAHKADKTEWERQMNAAATAHKTEKAGLDGRIRELEQQLNGKAASASSKSAQDFQSFMQGSAFRTGVERTVKSLNEALQEALNAILTEQDIVAFRDKTTNGKSTSQRLKEILQKRFIENMPLNTDAVMKLPTVSNGADYSEPGTVFVKSFTQGVIFEQSLTLIGRVLDRLVEEQTKASACFDNAVQFSVDILESMDTGIKTEQNSAVAGKTDIQPRLKELHAQYAAKFAAMTTRKLKTDETFKMPFNKAEKIFKTIRGSLVALRNIRRVYWPQLLAHMANSFYGTVKLDETSKEMSIAVTDTIIKSACAETKLDGKDIFIIENEHDAASTYAAARAAWAIVIQTLTQRVAKARQDAAAGAAGAAGAPAAAASSDVAGAAVDETEFNRVTTENAQLQQDKTELEQRLRDAQAAKPASFDESTARCNATAFYQVVDMVKILADMLDQGLDMTRFKFCTVENNRRARVQDYIEEINTKYNMLFDFYANNVLGQGIPQEDERKLTPAVDDTTTQIQRAFTKAFKRCAMLSGMTQKCHEMIAQFSDVMLSIDEFSSDIKEQKNPHNSVSTLKKDISATIKIMFDIVTLKKESEYPFTECYAVHTTKADIFFQPLIAIFNEQNESNLRRRLQYENVIDFFTQIPIILNFRRPPARERLEDALQQTPALVEETRNAAAARPISEDGSVSDLEIDEWISQLNSSAYNIGFDINEKTAGIFSAAAGSAQPAARTEPSADVRGAGILTVTGFTSVLGKRDADRNTEDQRTEEEEKRRTEEMLRRYQHDAPQAAGGEKGKGKGPDPKRHRQGAASHDETKQADSMQEDPSEDAEAGAQDMEEEHEEEEALPVPQGRFAPAKPIIRPTKFMHNVDPSKDKLCSEAVIQQAYNNHVLLISVRRGMKGRNLRQEEEKAAQKRAAKERKKGRYTQTSTNDIELCIHTILYAVLDITVSYILDAIICFRRGSHTEETTLRRLQHGMEWLRQLAQLFEVKHESATYLISNPSSEHLLDWIDLCEKVAEFTDLDSLNTSPFDLQILLL